MALKGLTLANPAEADDLRHLDPYPGLVKSTLIDSTLRIPMPPGVIPPRRSARPGPAPLQVGRVPPADEADPSNDG